MNPILPGEILLEEYLQPYGVSQNAFARAIGVSPRSVNEIVLGRRSITPDMSIRFGRAFRQSPRFWLNVQTECDFRRAMKRQRELTRSIRPLVALAE